MKRMQNTKQIKPEKDSFRVFHRLSINSQFLQEVFNSHLNNTDHYLFLNLTHLPLLNFINHLLNNNRPMFRNEAVFKMKVITNLKWKGSLMISK